MTELSLPILKSGLVFVTINLKDLASAPPVSYIDPVRALYAHHFHVTSFYGFERKFLPQQRLKLSAKITIWVCQKK